MRYLITKFWSGAQVDAILTRLYEVPGTKSRLSSMEGLRAYAAVMVFLVHYFYFFGLKAGQVNLNTMRFETVPDFETAIYYYFFRSHYGVDIFFLLSGFLVFKMIGRPNFDYATFLRRRLFRVYPALLFTTIIFFFFTLHKYPFDVSQLIGNILVLNGVPGSSIKPYNYVTWSIFYELSFYFIFPLLFALYGGQKWPAALFLFLAGIFILVLVIAVHGAYIRYLMFLGGAFLASLSTTMLSRITRSLPENIVVILYLSSTAFYVVYPNFYYFTPIYLVTSFLLVQRVLFGGGWLHQTFACRPARYIGNVSYSFYLVQLFTIKLGFYVVPMSLLEFNRHLYLLVTLTAAFFITFLLATLSFQLMERPYFSVSRPPSTATSRST